MRRRYIPEVLDFCEDCCGAIEGLSGYIEHVEKILLEVHATLSEPEVTMIFEVLDNHGTIRDVETGNMVETAIGLDESLHVLWTNEQYDTDYADA